MEDTTCVTSARVSVIICCYTLDRLADVHEAVDSVLAQTLTPHEVIISVDHNEELLERLREELPPSVALVSNDGERGLSETRNVGVRAATGDIVAFIDDDAVAEPEWLERLTRPFSDPRVAGVGGRAVPLWIDGEKRTWFPEELYWTVGCTYEGMPVAKGGIRNVMGCNMAFRKEVLSLVGLFGTGLGRVGKGVSGTAEETEACLRIRQVNHDHLIVFQPDARILHKVPSSRLTARYLLSRSWDEGLHKAKMNRTFAHQSSLSVEASYLRHLLLKGIPRRLMHPFRGASLAQAGAILASIMATGAGFAWGLVSGRR